MEIFFLVFMFILGIALGSFSCCQARRIELLKNGKKKQAREKRSFCLHCNHQLLWWENIPIVSWLVLRGKCSKCGKKIGVAEILSEIFMGVIFVVLGVFFAEKIGFSGGESFEICSGMKTCTEFVGSSWSGVGLKYVVELVILVILMTLFWILVVCDFETHELPVKILWATVIVAGIFRVVDTVWSFSGFDILSFVVAIGILAGVYYLLYFLSKEKLVGGGDWILALAIAILLGRWELALAELFGSNMLAAIYGMPLAVMKKARQVPFGPFLVFGFVIVFVLQGEILKFLHF